MIDSETAVARCADLVETARRLGADAADAVTSAQASESVSIRLGKLEEVERSEGESISLRVMVGQRSASIQTSDFSRDSFAELAERALAMARLISSAPRSAGTHAPATMTLRFLTCVRRNRCQARPQGPRSTRFWSSRAWHSARAPGASLS